METFKNKLTRELINKGKTKTIHIIILLMMKFGISLYFNVLLQLFRLIQH